MPPVTRITPDSDFEDPTAEASEAQAREEAATPPPVPQVPSFPGAAPAGGSTWEIVLAPLPPVKRERIWNTIQAANAEGSGLMPLIFLLLDAYGVFLLTIPDKVAQSAEKASAPAAGVMAAAALTKASVDRLLPLIDRISSIEKDLMTEVSQMRSGLQQEIRTAIRSQATGQAVQVQVDPVLLDQSIAAAVGTAFAKHSAPAPVAVGSGPKWGQILFGVIVGMAIAGAFMALVH